MGLMIPVVITVYSPKGQRPSKKQEETSWTTETVPAPYRAEVSMSTSAKRLKAFPPGKLNIELL